MESFLGVFFYSSPSIRGGSVCRVFSKELGCLSLFVPKKGRLPFGSPFVYSPFVFCKAEASLKKDSFFVLKNADVVFNPHNILPANQKGLLLLLSEVLLKTTRPGYKNPLLFSFLYTSLPFFVKKPSLNFLLFFFIGLLRCLGYSIRECLFEKNPGGLPGFSVLSTESKELFLSVLKTPFEKMDTVFLTKKDRRVFLGLIFDCYRLCVENFSLPKSYRVLIEVYEV